MDRIIQDISYVMNIDDIFCVPLYNLFLFFGHEFNAQNVHTYSIEKLFFFRLEYK